jgi:hypothetical protein
MFRKLSDRDGTPTVSLDKGDLQLDGIVDEDGEIPENQRMHVQRLGSGAYLVRAVTDDGVTEVSDVLRAVE